MQKRGQITVFIIIGIIMLFVTASIILIVNSSNVMESNVNKQFDTKSVEDFVENCLENSVNKALHVTLLKGGYEFSTAPYFKFENEPVIPYYLHEGKMKFPSIEKIQDETSHVVLPYFEKCIDNFSVYEKQGFQVQKDEIDLEILFTEKKTTLSLSFPFVLSKGSISNEYDLFNVVLPIDFFNAYHKMKQFLLLQKEENEYFLMSDLYDIIDDDFEIQFLDYGENGETYVLDLLIDSNLNEDPFIYRSAIKFNWDNIEYDENSIIEKGDFEDTRLFSINKMEEWNITSPGTYTYQVDATGENLIYEMQPETQIINSETGLITINTNDFPNDIYQFYITVKDGSGNIRQAPIIININTNDGSLPIIRPTIDQKVKVLQDYKYKVEISNIESGPFTFNTESYLLNINNTSGEILFKPRSIDVGNHEIMVFVENEHGETWTLWNLEVTK